MLLYWALAFLALGLVAWALSFGPLTASAAWTANAVFIVFLGLATVAGVGHALLRRGARAR